MAGCRNLIVILGDQLSHGISALRDADKDADVILMMEVGEEARYVPHHPQKIALILSAMRHFADELREKGHEVRYIRLDDEDNTGSFRGEAERAVKALEPDRITMTHPGEWRVLDDMRGWEKAFGIPVEIREDSRFLCPLQDFEDWAEGRKSLRMEHFYRMMRTCHDVLMDGDQPAGGKWNYDAENRQSLPDDVDCPAPRSFRPDKITQEVIELVRQRFSDHFGALDSFRWPVTRKEALAALRDFAKERLARFGDYQDAMVAGEPFLFHSLLSTSLNLGLLEPREVIEKVQKAYEEGAAPLNAVEGFIRQILGWREYVRGLYWLKMPDYKDTNALGADRALPDFYWTGKTDMRCLSESIGQIRDHAYGHHIQRLMVTGNFALLAGVAPAEIEAWYLAVFADAYEWVELPNVHGMVMFADGGLLASKPYAAGGAYINRMSDYCSGCRYNVSDKTGKDACPFNYLYWDFLARHRDTLKGNHRLGMVYRTWDGFDADRKRAIRASAQAFFDRLDSERV